MCRVRRVVGRGNAGSSVTGVKGRVLQGVKCRVRDLRHGVQGWGARHGGNGGGL